MALLFLGFLAKVAQIKSLILKISKAILNEPMFQECKAKSTRRIQRDHLSLVEPSIVETRVSALVVLPLWLYKPIATFFEAFNKAYSY